MTHRSAPPPSEQAESPTAKSGRSVSLDEIKASLWLQEQLDRIQKFLEERGADDEMLDAAQFLLEQNGVDFSWNRDPATGLIFIQSPASVGQTLAQQAKVLGPDIIATVIKTAFGDDKEALAEIVGVIGIEKMLNAVSDAAPTLNITVEVIGDNGVPAEVAPESNIVVSQKD